jgi:secreted trypsin-like serine protease
MLRRLAAVACLAALPTPLPAMVGGAPVAPADLARHVVLIVGSRGNSCTGVVIARDLVLTVAHCVPPGADYKLVEYDAARRPMLKDVREIARHPQFDADAVRRHRVTADVALMRLAAPLPAVMVPAPLGTRVPRAAGETFLVAGFGVTTPGDGRTGGTLRSATLVSTGKPGSLQLRLHDPQTRNARAGLSACTGDSGAPVFADDDGRRTVIGLVSWSTGANNSAGCGGLTGVTPLGRYRDWIAGEAARMRARLAP